MTGTERLDLRKAFCREEATKCCLIELVGVNTGAFGSNSLSSVNASAGEGQVLKDASGTVVL